MVAKRASRASGKPARAAKAKAVRPRKTARAPRKAAARAAAPVRGREAMKALKIEPEKCTGCMRCELACSYMQTDAFQPAKAVIRVAALEGHTSYAPYTCVQCAEGWCMTAYPVGAITITTAGAKAVLDDRCVGCKLCTIACPYGTMHFDVDRHKAAKCNLCGGDPQCAAACPTGAIVYVETDNRDWLGVFAAGRSAFDLAGKASAAH